MLKDWTVRVQKCLPFGVPIGVAWDKRESYWLFFVWWTHKILKEKPPKYILHYKWGQDSFSSSTHKIRLNETVCYKALHLGDKCFQYLLCQFPGLSFESIRAGVFDGLQIFTLATWSSFCLEWWRESSLVVFFGGH